MSLARMRALATPLGRQAPAREHPWGDLAKLDAIQQARRTTKRRLHDIGLTAAPTNIAGGLAGLVANPVTLNQATVTGSATEQTIIPTTLLPVEQNVQSGKVYYLWAGGTSTTAATPGTYTLAVRIGPAPTNASPLFGQVSSAFTPLASMTVSPWFLQGFVQIRGSGTANTASCSFSWAQTSVASAAAPGPTSVSSAGNIGGISASFDSTGSTCALWFGVTHATSTTNTWIPQQVIWGSWN